MSFGATRVSRLSAKGERSVDFDSAHGGVFVMPWETNRHVKHGVPHRVADAGRRISITLRAFAHQIRVLR
jgi:hypothetical protein